MSATDRTRRDLSSYASQLHTEVQHTVGAQLDNDLFINSLMKTERTLENSLAQQEGRVSMAGVPRPTWLSWPSPSYLYNRRGLLPGTSSLKGACSGTYRLGSLPSPVIVEVVTGRSCCGASGEAVRGRPRCGAQSGLQAHHSSSYSPKVARGPHSFAYRS